MNFKEYYKERLDKIITEGSMYVGRGKWEGVLPRVDERGDRISSIMSRYEPGYVPPPVPQREKKLGEVNIWNREIELKKVLDAHRERENPLLFDREQRAKRAEQSAADAAAEVAKREGVRNLLNAVHHYSRNFNMQLDPKHIEGIDFSKGTFNDHIDQISERLPSRFSYRIRR